MPFRSCLPVGGHGFYGLPLEESGATWVWADFRTSRSLRRGKPRGLHANSSGMGRTPLRKRGLRQCPRASLPKDVPSNRPRNLTLPRTRPDGATPNTRNNGETRWRLMPSQGSAALMVRDVDLPHVLAILEPIWAKTETATRLRGRIEQVLDWATARGHRDGPNPARWRGHLDKLLARPSKWPASNITQLYPSLR